MPEHPRGLASPCIDVWETRNSSQGFQRPIRRISLIALSLSTEGLECCSDDCTALLSFRVRDFDEQMQREEDYPEVSNTFVDFAREYAAKAASILDVAEEEDG